MNTPLHLLVVEDAPDDAELLVREVARSGFEVRWKRVETEAAYLAALQTKPDLILSDYSMPQFNGLRALDLLRASGLPIPFILISGTVGEDTAVEAVKRGATDYLLKDRIGRLGMAVRRALQELSEAAQIRKLQAQFIEAQKMEVIGQLAGGVAHDFNNILMTIMGNNDLIAQEAPPDSRLQDYAAEIRHAAQRAAGLTKQLLVFSRREKVQPVVLDLNEVVRDHERMLRRVAGETVEIVITPGGRTGRIRADSGYVGQVLMNLAVNARDAIQQGGRLFITVSDAVLPADCGEARAGDYVVLTVSDNGAGMTHDVKARIFEAFFTTKPKGKGTGLGLATCQTIVQQLGGCIEVDSEPGKGTEFRIFFPAVAEAPAAPPLPAAGAPVPRGHETLLVVEDEDSVRSLARGVLTFLGYQVLTASNGREALSLVHAHQEPPISLVLTDVIMPEMGGRELAASLRVTHPGLRILFTSGYTDDALGPHGGLAAEASFLPKPYTVDRLARKVRELLDQPA